MRARRRWWPRSWLGWTTLIAAGVFVGIPLATVVFGLLVGLLFGLAGVVLGFLAFAWPILLVFGIYKLVRHQRRVAPWAAGADASWAPAPPPPRDPYAGLPEELRVLADRIHGKATSLLGSGRFPTGSRNLHLVRRTLDEYLPATLQSYLSVPPGSDERVAAPDGRTTIQVAHDQLTLLETKLDEVADDLWQADVQRLLANERFLEDHFGRREPDELKIP
jgi:hypothetical protein